MYKVKIIKNTCPACPSQWEGKTDKGRDIYIRYRWGYLTVQIDGVQGREILGMDLGRGNWDGVLNFHDMKNFTKSVLNFEGVELERRFNKC